MKTSKGIEIPLAKKDSSGRYVWFFSSPSGLGFSKSFETTRIESTFITTDKYYNQPIISGEMAFNSYESYKAFFDSIINERLQFMYSPANNDKWYYRDCEIQQVDKTEFSGAYLRCPVDFICSSHWRSNSKLKSITLGSDSIKKTYPYTYPHVYSDASNFRFKISNLCANDCPCKLSIATPVKNPKWVLMQGEKEISSGLIYANSAVEGGELVINSEPNNMEIAFYFDGTRTDYYQNSDFSTSRFLYIPPGDSILTVEHELDSPINIVLEMYQDEFAV